MVPKITEEKRLERQAQILEAAKTCFSQKGYKATTLDDIVSLSGLSKGTLYWYFKSKEEIFLAVLEKQTTENLNRLETIFEPNDTPEQKLEKAAEFFFDNLKEECQEQVKISLEFWAEATRNPRLKKYLSQIYQKVHSFFSKLLKEGIEAGEIRRDIDISLVTSIILATCDGLPLHWVTADRTFDPLLMKQAFLATFREGLATKKTSK